MVTQKTIQDILSEKVIAVAGVSRKKEKFGNVAYRELKAKGYKVYPVNPNIDSYEGEKCYPSLKSLPEKPGAVFSSVNKENALQIAKDAFDNGITKLWIQKGGESEEAIAFCQSHNMNVVYKECVLMFAQPSGFHKFHKIVKGLFGGLPSKY